MKGKFIAIEGTDGSGKQTQAKMLCDRLREEGKNVIALSFPNYQSISSGPVKLYLGGELVDNPNKLDAYQASALFAVDRLCGTINIKEHLEHGGWVVSDRYTYSNMIHQAGKIENKEERDKFLEWLSEFEFETLKLPKADMVIFLDVPVETSIELARAREKLKVGRSQDIHEKDVNYLTNAYKTGKEVAEKFGWKIIPCTDEGMLMSIHKIHSIILSKIER